MGIRSFFCGSDTSEEEAHALIFQMNQMIQTAFKEWGIIVDALASGRQILILRKGGIHEGKQGFKVEHESFLLFPTLYHQQRENVIPAAQERYDQIAGKFQDPDSVLISHFAIVTRSVPLANRDMLGSLQDQHIWKAELLNERFDWGREAGVFAILVRVYELSDARRLPVIPAYGGCKSWITLQESFDTSSSVPVLSDQEFNVKTDQFLKVVGGL